MLSPLSPPRSSQSPLLRRLYPTALSPAPSPAAATVSCAPTAVPFAAQSLLASASPPSSTVSQTRLRARGTRTPAEASSSPSSGQEPSAGTEAARAPRTSTASGSTPLPGVVESARPEPLRAQVRAAPLRSRSPTRPPAARGRSRSPPLRALLKPSRTCISQRMSMRSRHTKTSELWAQIYVMFKSSTKFTSARRQYVYSIARMPSYHINL